MFLLVNPNGSRWWRLKYRFGGKEKLLALGTYPDISLKCARESRDVARSLLKDGRDPGDERKTARRSQRLAAENSFETIAREFAENQTARWSKAHKLDVVHRLEKYVFPDLGARPIAEIGAPELLETIRKLEARGATEISQAWCRRAAKCSAMASQPADAREMSPPICAGSAHSPRQEAHACNPA